MGKTGKFCVLSCSMLLFLLLFASSGSAHNVPVHPTDSGIFAGHMSEFAEITPSAAASDTINDYSNSQNSRIFPRPPVNRMPSEANTPAANRWAVIISGGYNQSSNHVRFWNDCSYFYRTLKANGFSDDHIFVLMSDGTDPAIDRSDGTNSPLDLDSDGDNDIQYSATRANITAVFNNLQSQLGSEDILYIFTTGNGGSNDVAPYDQPTSFLYLWGETISDLEFAAEVNKPVTKARVAIFEQSYSGGMIDNLEGANRVLMSAARFWELSHSMSDEVHDEFSYYVTHALANPAAADTNADGTVSMEESYLYALARDSHQSEALPGGDNLGEHPGYYSNPWYLGRQISLGGYTEVVDPPKLGGYVQREVTEPYPSGGVLQSWYGDDAYFTYDLPFAFPFSGQNYNRVYVGTNGIIYLGNPSTSYLNSINGLKSRKAIAPLWDDLTVLSADGDGIYVTADTYWVTIRWQAHTKQDKREVNFSVKLSTSGAIRFLYGEGNDHTGRVIRRDKTIGISNGDGSKYHLCLRNGRDNLGFAKGIEFYPTSGKAGRILYFSDLDLGNNPFPTALTQLGLESTVAADFNDFEARLKAGHFDLVILLLQNYSPGIVRPLSFPNFTNYLDKGGKAIFVDWYRDPLLAPKFGITFVGGPGRADTLGCNDSSVTLIAPFLKNAVGNQISLLDPGWSHFSVGMNLSGALEAARYTNNGYVAIAYTPRP
ncbi:MAG: C13 family peptidase [Syntrophobacteraceae bacterium]